MSAESRSSISEDVLAITCGFFILVLSLFGTWLNSPASAGDQPEIRNPFARIVGKPAKWEQSPLDAFVKYDANSSSYDFSSCIQLAGTIAILALILGVGIFVRQGTTALRKFLLAFAGIYLLATVAYLISANVVVKAYNLEYALWALGIGMIISNTVGTPAWLKPAVRTEFFIKTGLVVLGAEILMSKLMKLGIPGIGVAWIVTPIVLISTYWFGQRILKLKSRSLNMVISADMSVCGVSAAIASAAACNAKKEELSLAIGMSLSFTVIMMIVLPLVIRALGISDLVGGAWLGGTIDSTGAVGVAGATLGDEALNVAATVKMIQNVLIGVAAFGIATYWVTVVERNDSSAAASNKPQISEIWVRFPKFILGFLAASILFSILHRAVPNGPEFVDSVIKGSTKVFRGWLFCLAFVSIGLETRFVEIAKNLKGGKPVLLYIAGQSLNLVLTLIMAYLMFGILFSQEGQ